MNRSGGQSPGWIYWLTSSLLFGGVVLRLVQSFEGDPRLGTALDLLLAWLALFVYETAVRYWRPGFSLAFFPLYLVLQAAIVFSLMLWFVPDSPDYCASLYGILTMQIVQRGNPKWSAVGIGLFALLTLAPLYGSYELAEAIQFTLIYVGANAILASFALATRRAQDARVTNQTLMQEQQEANRQLQQYSSQLEQMALTRERQRLARELHDSVTQTIFSMTLVTQSAMLLLDRDPNRVRDQLGRLEQLTRSALAEIRMLISELRPDKVAEGGLVTALRRHLASREMPEPIAVSLEVEGDCLLRPLEEQNLFRIAQEALNNVVKHAHASHAVVDLHLLPPVWMEVRDDGCGFEPQRVQDGGRVGLAGMRERAAEMGWDFQVETAIGGGTRVRVTGPAEKGRQNEKQ